MMLWDFKCDRCGWQREVLVCPGEKPSCCQKKMRKLFTMSKAYDRGYARRRFPYYDENLDRQIESPQHKKRVLKEMNLVQHDGFFTKGGVKKEKRGVIYG